MVFPPPFFFWYNAIFKMIIIELSDNSEKNISLLYSSLQRVVKGSNLVAGPSSSIGIILFFLCEQFIWHVVIYKKKKKSFDMYERMWIPIIRSYKNVAARLLLLPLSDFSIWPVYFLFYLFVFVRSKPIFLCLYKTK